MKQYRVTIDGRIYEVQIDDPHARPVTARVSGVAYSVDVEALRPVAKPDHAAPPGVPTNRVAPPPPAGPTVSGKESMAAPIPGVVSAVMVAAGQTVEQGDELLTIEAMKMFNVIRSPWAGTIATVHVTEGKRVSQGEPLVTFMPSS